LHLDAHLEGEVSLDIRKLEVLSAIAMITAVFVTFILLLSMDTIVNQNLYRYGLQFSYEWANPYWLYLRTSLALLILTTIAIIVRTIAVLNLKVEPAATEKKLFRVLGVRVEREVRERTLLKMDADWELLRLRKRLLQVRGRRSRMAGVAFLMVSVVFLFLAYSTRYLAFEATSILALLLGIIFVFSNVEPYVRVDVADRAIVSPLVPLASLLHYLKAEGKAIYLPPASEQHSGKIFIPTKGVFSLPTSEEMMTEDSLTILDRGVLMPTISSALLQLYEHELGDIRKVDLEYLMVWLPRVLVDVLQLAEKMKMIENTKGIHVRMIDSAFRNLCLNPNAKIVCEIIGCPLCSSIAEALSKNTGRIVYFLGCENNVLKRETNVFYRLGPALNELSKEKVEELSGKKG